MAIHSMKETVSMFEPIYNDGDNTIYLSDQLEDNKDGEYDMHTRLALKDDLNKMIRKMCFI